MNPLLIAADWFGYPPQGNRRFYVCRAVRRWCVDEYEQRECVEVEP